MQLKIKVKVPDLGRQVRARLDAVVPTVLNTLASFTRDRLVAAAQKNLKGNAQREYIRGLTEPESVEVKEDIAVVRLVGDFPSALEQGSSSFDIKAAMLKGATKRTSDGKPYVDVPFRHGVNEDAENLSGMPRSVASSMGVAVKQAHAALRQAGMTPREAALVPVRNHGRTSARTITKRTSTGQTIVARHKRGIFDDMLRIPKQYGKAIQATYLTIRRISEKSDPSSWIHPGFKPVKLFDNVIDEVKKLAPKIVSDVLKGAGF